MKIKKISLWPTVLTISFVFAAIGLFKGILSILPFQPFFFSMGTMAGNDIPYSLGVISASVLKYFLEGFVFGTIGIITYNAISKNIAIEYRI